MDPIDRHYFSSFKKMSSPFYDWERLIINMGCDSTEVDINNLSNSAANNEKANYSILIHEYIHYLQNFSTAWGVPVFTDFTLALMKIGGSATESQEMLHPAVVTNNLKSALLRSGLDLRNDVLKRLNKCNGVQTENNGTLSKIILKIEKETCAVLSNGRVSTELGIKVIREHMAHLGTQLFLAKTDEGIHTYHENKLGLGLAGEPFSDQSEYWVLFEYLYECNCFQDIARGLFHLMQQCLITLNPEKALLRFMEWFSGHQTNYAGQTTSFLKLINDWLADSKEVYFISVGLQESIKHSKEFLKLCKKHRSEHDMYRFAHDLTAYALNNIEKTNGGCFIFQPADDLTDINYWKAKMVEFGTGIIIYVDGPKIHGKPSHCDEMVDDFNFLLSCSLVVKKLFEEQITECPFLSDIPICSAEFKGSENCTRNPFLMLQRNTSGKECLFGSGVLLMGLQDRVSED